MVDYPTATATPRTLDTNAEAEYASDVLTQVTLVKLDFPDEALHVTNMVGPIDWDGEEWIGVGGVGRIGDIDETFEVRASTLTLELTGVRPSDIVQVKQQKYRGRKVKVWEALLNRDTRAIIGEPTLWWVGFMDTPRIERGEKEAKIVLTSWNRLASWERATNKRRTYADQIQRYANDTGLSRQAELLELRVTWGIL